MTMNKAKVIAFYLPQFHPIPENDIWWGKGFTEWTNVAKAKPLYNGHYQPRIPKDLGFYDLRLEETRILQAELANEAGVSAFCYWHYWFGNGKQLLEKPLQDVVKSDKPNFPFCLAWANHSWQKKSWNSDVSRLSKELLVEQLYPGRKDVDDHFYAMLSTFKDKRYFKIEDKLVFIFYCFEDILDSDYFINRWQELALINNIPGFYFIGHTSNIDNINNGKYKKLDAINLHLLSKCFNESKLNRFKAWILNRPQNIISYSEGMKYWEDEILCLEKVFPTIYPNWDTTPRIGVVGTILNDSTPKLFKKHVNNILKLISKKSETNKIIFLKSWNEWAEGNYLEPDLKFGTDYINALKEALKK